VSTAVDGRPARLTPVAIGLTLVFSILMGALTGACARRAGNAAGAHWNRCVPE
jgi:hypothetical protein